MGMKTGQQPNPYNPTNPMQRHPLSDPARPNPPVPQLGQPPMMGQQIGQQMIAPMTIGDVGRAPQQSGQQMNPTQQPIQAQGYGMNPQHRQMMARALGSRNAVNKGY